MTERVLYLGSLTRLDQLDMSSLSEKAPIEFREDMPIAHEHREFMTGTAVMVLGLAALRVIAMWIAKNRSRTNFEHVYAIEAPDGTVKQGTMKLTVSADTSEAEIIRLLSESFGVTGKGDAPETLE